jgi:hypothetical protein
VFVGQANGSVCRRRLRCQKCPLNVVVGRANTASEKTLAYLVRNFPGSCLNGMNINSSSLEGVTIMDNDKELLDWVSPRKQREIDNQAAFLRYLLEREEAQVGAK